MAKKKVLYYNIDDNLDYERGLLTQWGIEDLELVEIKDYDREKPFVVHAREVDGVVVEYQQLTREIIEQLPNLKIISLQAIGVDNVDVEAATDHGVSVTNCPEFCSEEVALHTIGLMIDLTRKITLLDRSVRHGKWDPLYGYKTYRLTGKTVGLYFFGSIPKAMMPMLQALNVRVLVYAPTKTKAFLKEFGVEKVDTFEELLTQSDILSLHCPLLDSTAHLISERELKMMKKDAFLINTARGKVVDETALVKALKEGEIKAAAVDVIEDETTETSPLFALDNTIITPHSAFVSEDSFYNARKIALEQLVQRLSKNQKPEHLVNPNVM
ncbi:C-terminal binding protein [Sporolactobacillus laevolacticus]|uniref:Hydroxyacid dehydrogenase n=1 Tax=Sporolactobacillus laevolacticus DSM 442 TaxID=1395513 RepID=V6J7F0_9BACL|nr:C-terminal binding protein [Sporolactobacillus laevolacticus]EST12689.1 hydroxyacid dehydrogenase [Sporolactobacillus laevolacticus DSM 442]